MRVPFERRHLELAVGARSVDVPVVLADERRRADAPAGDTGLLGPRKASGDLVGVCDDVDAEVHAELADDPLRELGAERDRRGVDDGVDVAEAEVDRVLRRPPRRR